jgi:thiol-disulfide isomerase/thioredoxin
VRRPISSRGVGAVVVAAVATVLLTSACTTSGGSRDGSAGITGAGSIVTVSPADRHDPVELSGETLEGAKLDVAVYRGQVVVVHYWASWCGPCRGEAPDLVAAQRQLPKAQFIGLDSNDDSQANGLAFARTFDVPYPSIHDSGGKVLLAFDGAVPLTSLPSTIVLDAAGRVAAVVLGTVTTTTLVDLVHDVAEQA